MLRCSWSGRPGQDHTGTGNEVVFCFQSNEHPLKNFKQRSDKSDLHLKKITWLCAK